MINSKSILFTAVLMGMATLNAQLVTIDMVSVGNAGNADADVTNTSHGQTGAYGYGGVGYDYQIGRTEVTLNQYSTFLNAVADSDPYGLYNTNMSTAQNIAGISRSGMSGSYSYSVIGSGARPVSYVSWFDAARFSNWLHNGATGSSDTETGAYTLNGATSGIISANVNAQYWIPTEDEWYKAAYYDPTLNSGAGGYTLHANRSDTLTSNNLGAPDAANFKDGDFTTTPGNNTYSSSQNYLTDVGAFTNTSNYYGTFDQGGNLWELNDAIVSSNRGIRGGNWGNSESNLRASNRNNSTPTNEAGTIGFRVASIPEPSVMLLITLGASAVVLRKRFSL
jgi:formylglycine-generating enzyme